MPTRPSLLFLSPVMPAAQGNGLAMRAGVFLEIYARRFDVTLAVLPVAEADLEVPVTDFARRHAARVEVLPLDPLLHPHYRLIAGLRDPGERDAALALYPRPRQCAYDAAGAGELLRTRLGTTEYDLLHAERLYLAPLAVAGPAARHLVLDLDEDDCATQRSIALLHGLNGEQAAAVAASREAEKFGRLRREYLPRFDVALLAAPDEAAALAREWPEGRIHLVPNTLRPAARLPASTGKTIDYLMVGTLSYYPNIDGACFFCRDVLPAIRRAGLGAKVAIAGRGPVRGVSELAELPGVSVHAGPADLAPLYESAAVAVVPLRAGGGSRIKILEAFAHGLPVVSTRIGAAGLDVVEGRHLLLADGAEDFAAAALRLRGDPRLSKTIAVEARALFERRYLLENAAADVEFLLGSLSAGGGAIH